MTIVEEDTDWGKSCQRAWTVSSWRSHVAHVCSIHPGWNTQRREMHPEGCSMECVHGMCAHGAFFMWDVGVQPALIFGQMEVCCGFWLTHLLNMCDLNVCCAVCRMNNKRKEGVWEPRLITMFLSSSTCSVPSQWNMGAFTCSTLHVSHNDHRKVPREKTCSHKWKISMFKQKVALYTLRWCHTCIGWPHQITGQLHNWMLQSRNAHNSSPAGITLS